jgi:sortase A
MAKYIYTKGHKPRKKKVIKLSALGMFLTGIFISLYVFFPLLSWQIYFAPVFANQNISSPIPKSNVVSNSTVKTLLSQATNNLSGVDYSNAQNWFPSYKYHKVESPKTSMYTITIPKIKIENAVVSAVDIELDKHLVNYGGTSIPPQKGNAVVFGHSTLPQLYDPKNYKTVFTNLFKLQQGDEIIVNVMGKVYNYRTESITVVDPDNTSVLEQNYDSSFLTLVTCTPPGTIWKRLIVKARLIDK